MLLATAQDRDRRVDNVQMRINAHRRREEGLAIGGIAIEKEPVIEIPV